MDRSPASLQIDGVTGLVELDRKVDTVGTILEIELFTNCKPDSERSNSHSDGSESKALSENFLAASLQFIVLKREAPFTAHIDG